MHMHFCSEIRAIYGTIFLVRLRKHRAAVFASLRMTRLGDVGRGRTKKEKGELLQKLPLFLFLFLLLIREELMLFLYLRLDHHILDLHESGDIAALVFLQL